MHAARSELILGFQTQSVRVLRVLLGTGTAGLSAAGGGRLIGDHERCVDRYIGTGAVCVPILRSPTFRGLLCRHLVLHAGGRPVQAWTSSRQRLLVARNRADLSGQRLVRQRFHDQQGEGAAQGRMLRPMPAPRRRGLRLLHPLPLRDSCRQFHRLPASSSHSSTRDRRCLRSRVRSRWLHTGARLSGAMFAAVLGSAERQPLQPFLAASTVLLQLNSNA